MPRSYFQRVRWFSGDPADPIVLWSQITDQWEVRKVDEFADGRLVWADSEHEAGSTRLGAAPVPPIEGIADDSQFVAELIDESDFERVWARARSDS